MKTTGCAGSSKKLSLCLVPPQRKASLVQREVAKIGSSQPIFDGGIDLIVIIPQSACSADSPLSRDRATLALYTRGLVHTTGTAGGYDLFTGHLPAQSGQGTILALRISCGADFPSKQHNAMAEI